MKLQYLLLFAASALLIDPIEMVRSAPVRFAYETQAQGASQVYQQVNPAVVTVYAGREIGSGSIVSPNGLVITNNHVVRESNQVYARLSDGRRIPGQVIGSDLRRDLALIQLDTSESLPTVKFANGGGIQPGQTVIAIGSPYGRPGVMTQGTFTSTRSNGDLQSRVVLEPGNSGGPLLNAQGELVGVNKAILESSRGGNTGISISTSGAAARSFVEQLRPGSLVASSSSQFRAQAQPRYTQQAPVYPASRFGSEVSPSIATLPTLNPPAPAGATWGYQSIVPTPNTGSTVNTPLYESGGNTWTNGRRSDVVVPVEAPWQTSQSPYAMPYPTVEQPDQSAMPQTQSPEPLADDNYPDTPQTPVPSGAKLGVIVDIRTMVIQQVRPGAAGANSGLRVGDRLLAVNGSELRSFDELQAFMNQAPPAAAFTISRAGRSATVQVRF